MATIVEELVTVMTTITGALTEKPLSYFLYAGLAGIGITLFAKMRKSTGAKG